MAARKKKISLADDLDAIRSDAENLLALQSHEIPMMWTDWELDYLEDMARRSREEPLSDAQVAKFDQLRRLSTLLTHVDGLCIARLVSSCHLEADYLDEEDDRSFIRALWQSGASQLRRRDAGRLLKCSRELEVIEQHQGFADEAVEASI